MNISRREVLAGFGRMAVWNATSGARGSALPSLADIARADTPSVGGPLPAKRDFSIPEGLTYLNCAYTHPLPKVGLEALRAYGDRRARPEAVSRPLHEKPVDIKAEFAALINAKKSEISFIPNTSTGENLVVNGLDIPRSGGNVVTDELHFEGALLHLQALQQKAGLDLRVVKPHEWRIELKDLERAIDKKTRLVEVSLVAMDNGFQHDLKRVCDVAHASGAYVYADIVQAAGNTPIDVRAYDVDFCACSSFKWLMGDFGLGFLFVKESLLDKVIERTQYGYYQAQELESHFLPGDTPGAVAYTWELSPDATGHFEVGTQAIGAGEVLAETLPYIRSLGVQNIHAHRQPLLEKLRADMPRLGFQPLTPPESTSAIISFVVRNPDEVRKRLAKAQVNVRVSDRYIRISPSIFNDMSDIDRLLEALQ
ncbi:MAG TPA: aminotransferase class V-fold PLP-dependent enzyme [Candidatus Acidoferrum sp.]|nr:aminotransferase class V-fold PLP-dependent enzyme [Candidatus Acidoferrum sp.]